RLTPLGLWNARAAGHDAEQVVDALITYSRYPLPHALLVDIAATMSRYGRLPLVSDPARRLLRRALDAPGLPEVMRAQRPQALPGEQIDEETVVVPPSARGHLKQVLVKLGWPAEDLAGYVDGEAHEISLDTSDWALRPYQEEAVEGFWHGGSGVVVLPCGRSEERRVGKEARSRGGTA